MAVPEMWGGDGVGRHVQVKPGGLTRPRMGAHGGRGLGGTLGSLPGHRASTLTWICKSGLEARSGLVYKGQSGKHIRN